MGKSFVPLQSEMDEKIGIQTRDADGRRQVFDPVRRRWVTLTPEEWVRQHTIALLHNSYGFPLEVMQVEGTIALNDMVRRCDIVVYDNNGTPWMIVECKKEGVALTQKVCDQACRYNTVLRVPLLLLTNGRQVIVLRCGGSCSGLSPLGEIPHWQKKMLKSEPPTAPRRH